MNTATPEKTAAAAPDPKAWGSLTKMLSRVIGHMPADDRTALMQDAATFSQNEIGKAREILAAETGHEKIGIIDDLWDEAPDASPKIVRAHGPASSVASGGIPVGPEQRASGDGAEAMDRQYNGRFAPQSGVQAATEKLGRELMSVAKALSAVMQAMDGQNAQIEILKSTVTIQAPAALQAMISETVTKAIAPLRGELLKAVAKADKAKKDDEEDDDEAKHGEFGKSSEVLVKAEKDEEDDEPKDEKEKSAAIEAAELRLLAKSRIAYAKMRISKALDLTAEDKAKGAERAYGLAAINVAKAQAYIDQALVLREGRIGTSSETIIKGIAKAKSNLPASEVKMQEKYPASDAPQVGKAVETAATGEAVKAEAAPPANAADMAKAMEQIQKAAEGMGMLQATVGDLMGALARGHETSAPGGNSDKLPPVWALAKANPGDYATREAELARLRDSSVISFDDHDRARDVITRARMQMPEDTIKAMIEKLPAEARAILNRNAA